MILNLSCAQRCAFMILAAFLEQAHASPERLSLPYFSKIFDPRALAPTDQPSFVESFVNLRLTTQDTSLKAQFRRQKIEHRLEQLSTLQPSFIRSFVATAEAAQANVQLLIREEGAIQVDRFIYDYAALAEKPLIRLESDALNFVTASDLWVRPRIFLLQGLEKYTPARLKTLLTGLRQRASTLHDSVLLTLTQKSLPQLADWDPTLTEADVGELIEGKNSEQAALLRQIALLADSLHFIHDQSEADFYDGPDFFPEEVLRCQQVFM